MTEKKLRVVHYLNQFFGQIGAEDKADTGFTVKQGPVGPGLALQNELGDRAEVVATVICGDNYFAKTAGPVFRRTCFRSREIRDFLRCHLPGRGRKTPHSHDYRNV